MSCICPGKKYSPLQPGPLLRQEREWQNHQHHRLLRGAQRVGEGGGGRRRRGWRHSSCPRCCLRRRQRTKAGSVSLARLECRSVFTARSQRVCVCCRERTTERAVQWNNKNNSRRFILFPFGKTFPPPRMNIQCRCNGPLPLCTCEALVSIGTTYLECLFCPAQVHIQSASGREREEYIKP